MAIIREAVEPLIALRLAEVHVFMTNFAAVKHTFPTPTAWVAGQFLLLSLKANGPMPVKALTYDMRKLMSEAGVHRLIRKVEKAGYIEVGPAPDKRSRLCHLNPAGAGLLDRAMKNREAMMEKRGVELYDRHVSKPLKTGS